MLQNEAVAWKRPVRALGGDEQATLSQLTNNAFVKELQDMCNTMRVDGTIVIPFETKNPSIGIHVSTSQPIDLLWAQYHGVRLMLLLSFDNGLLASQASILQAAWTRQTPVFGGGSLPVPKKSPASTCSSATSGKVSTASRRPIAPNIKRYPR